MANKYVNFNAPSPYASQQADLERRQRLAELMQQQAMQPIETNNTSITPTQGLAKVLQSYLSAKQLANLTQEEKDIETNQGKEVARYLEGRNPQPTVNLPDVAPSFEKSVYTPSQFTPPDSVTTPPLQNMVGNPQSAFIDRARDLPYLESKLTPEQIRAKDTGKNVAPNKIEKQVTDLFKAYDENLKASKEEGVDNSKSNLIPITAPEQLFNEVPTVTDAQRQAMDLSAVASNNPRLSQLAQYLSQQEVAARAANLSERKETNIERRLNQSAETANETARRLQQNSDRTYNLAVNKFNKGDGKPSARSWVTVIGPDGKATRQNLSDAQIDQVQQNGSTVTDADTRQLTAGQFLQLNQDISIDLRSISKLNDYKKSVEFTKQGYGVLADKLATQWKTMFGGKLDQQQLSQAAQTGQLNSLIGNLRLDLLGGGVMTEQDAGRVVSALGGDLSMLRNKEVVRRAIENILESKTQRVNSNIGIFNNNASLNNVKEIAFINDQPTAEAIKYLQDNPDTANFFDKKYGSGASSKFLTNKSQSK